MNPFTDLLATHTRRQFLARGKDALGMAALASLLGNGRSVLSGAEPAPIGAIGPHFPAKAKQVIYLHMVGGPSQMDLFDYKPQMNEWYDKDLPP